MGLYGAREPTLHTGEQKILFGEIKVVNARNLSSLTSHVHAIIAHERIYPIILETVYPYVPNSSRFHCHRQNVNGNRQFSSANRVEGELKVKRQYNES